MFTCGLGDAELEGLVLLRRVSSGSAGVHGRCRLETVGGTVEIARFGGFPQLGVPFWGSPIIRTLVY